MGTEKPPERSGGIKGMAVDSSFLLNFFVQKFSVWSRVSKRKKEIRIQSFLFSNPDNSARLMQ